MYKIKKTISISCAHQLHLPYESKCNNLHGHNWEIVVYCKAEKLNKNGMVIDFTHIKDKIYKPLDHKNLNDVLDFETTAENLAKWVVEQIDCCYKAEIFETNSSLASYEQDN